MSEPDIDNASLWSARRGSLAILLIALIIVVAAGLVVLRQVPSFGFYGAAKDFPPIHNLSSVRISLQRSLCFGEGPAYSLEISGNGDVIYHGQQCVAEKGTRTARITQARV